MMLQVKKELMDFYQNSPRYVMECIADATNGRDFSDYSVEETVMEEMTDEEVLSVVNRLRRLNDKEPYVFPEETL